VFIRDTRPGDIKKFWHIIKTPLIKITREIKDIKSIIPVNTKNCELLEILKAKRNKNTKF
jgi:hypothetical protein